MRAKKIAKRAAGLGAAGYALSTPVVELYIHSHNAHGTVKLNDSMRAVGWGISRLTGFDPTSWAINHRWHHADDDVVKPHGKFSAITKAFKNGSKGKDDVEKLLSDPANERFLRFDNVPIDEDPVLRRDKEGNLMPRYQNKLDEKLSFHKFGRFVGPAVAFLALSATSREPGVKNKLVDGAVKTTAFTAGLYAPAFVGGAYFEALDGYRHGSEAGRDGGVIAQIACGGFALHRSHHEQPDKFTPDSPGIHRDRAVLQAFTRLGLAEER